MTLVTDPPRSDPANGAEPPLSPRNQEKAHALGLTSATGLVIGSIVGTGVFTMPAVIAGAGTMGIIVLGVIAVGAMLLAILFGQLTRRIPNSDGGLYAYSRHEFGDFAGYLVGWCYWIQSWAGNAAIVVLVGVLRRRPVRMGPSVGHGQLGHRHGRPMGAGARQPGRHPPDGLVPEHHGGAQVPAPAVRRHRGVVLRHRRPLRTLQRLGGEPLQRHRHRRGRGPLLLHRRRGGGGDGQAGAEPPGQRGAGLRPRHRPERRALRAGHRGGHGPGRPPHPGQHRVAVRERLRLDVPPQQPGPGSSSPRSPWSPASAPSTGGRSS